MISDLEFGIADFAPTYRPLAQATFASGFVVSHAPRRLSNFEIPNSKSNQPSGGSRPSEIARRRLMGNCREKVSASSNQRSFSASVMRIPFCSMDRSAPSKLASFQARWLSRAKGEPTGAGRPEAQSPVGPQSPGAVAATERSPTESSGF